MPVLRSYDQQDSLSNVTDRVLPDRVNQFDISFKLSLAGLTIATPGKPLERAKEKDL